MCRDIKRLVKIRPTMFEQSLSPRGDCCSEAAQASLDSFIRQLHAAFLEHRCRSDQPVHQDDLDSDLFVMLLQKRLGCARQLQQMKLFGSALNCQLSK